MNWTAILALLALAFVVTGGSLIFAWSCNRACEVTVGRMSDTMRREADEHNRQIGELNADRAMLVRQLADAERRARRRQRTSDSRPSGPRTGETES